MADYNNVLATNIRESKVFRKSADQHLPPLKEKKKKKNNYMHVGDNILIDYMKVD